MFDTTVISVIEGTGKESGKPYKAIWYRDELDRPTRNFCNIALDVKKGDKVRVSIGQRMSGEGFIDFIKIL